MQTQEYQEVADAFLPAGHPYRIEQITGGLINHSFRLTDEKSGDTYFLQALNTKVFSEPGLIQANYSLLCKQLPAFPLPAILLFNNGDPLFRSGSGRTWRVFRFIPDAISYLHTDSPETAEAVATAFARFTAACAGIQPADLYCPLPGFHNLENRYADFTAAVQNAGSARKEKAAALIRELLQRNQYVVFYNDMTRSPEFPLRVMHHDAKISNVLFSQSDNRLLTLVDFDTAMPGYFISDLGDMVRSMAGTTDENNTDVDSIRIRPAIYKAILDGYTMGMNDCFTKAEKENLHMAGPLLIYMQALRFLTDYLQEDRYYKISYPEQNFDRALNQVTLLNRLEEFLANTYNFTKKYPAG